MLPNQKFALNLRQEVIGKKLKRDIRTGIENMKKNAQ